MNRLLPAVLVAVLLLSSGCKLFDGAGRPPTDRIRSAAMTAAYLGGALYLVDRPDAVDQFAQAVESLDALLDAPSIDPLLVHGILLHLDIGELRGQEAAIIIGAAQLLWEEYGLRQDLAEVGLRPIVAGLRDGLQRAVEQQ